MRAWIVLMITGSGCLAARPAPSSRADCAVFDQAHRRWSELLGGHVDQGRVDYMGLRGRVAELDAYLDDVEAVCVDDYAAWTEDERLAFWINAYNAYTVWLVVTNDPAESIRDLGLPGEAFWRDFMPLERLQGEHLSLYELEHAVLRRDFAEPRLHFAIVCASESCPELGPEPYVAARLQQQLDEAATAFVRDPTKNHFDATSRTLHLSSIFDWFREDFERGGQTLPSFVARYADAATAAELGKPGVVVEFNPYNWSLNGR